MDYPIKYIENNLVFNNKGDCYAYYELLPYNYSFLSSDEKMQVRDGFRQLVAQSKNGSIHALQISTESSIAMVQEECKRLVRGDLKHVAIDRIDGQTKALTSALGETQVDYRFFIGFKLMLTEQDLSIKNMKKEISIGFGNFINEVNHKMMDDFIKVSNTEIKRYAKVENLLIYKINKRFSFRPLDKNDFGYLIEHVNGGAGVFEEYNYFLPTKKVGNETYVKRYDIMKPFACHMEERQRYLILTNENDKKTYCSYFTISGIVGELDFPNSEIFYYQQQQFDFPIDTSMNIEVVENKKALTTVRNKKKELKDLDNHAWENNTESGNNVGEALENVDELESDLEQTKENMYKVSYVVRVTAPTLDELKKRCEEVKDFYDDFNIKLVRPFGDMLGLHSEFYPSNKRYINDYIQYVTSDFLASLGFGSTQKLGESIGEYIGYNLDTGRNVYIQPALAAQGIKGSVTNALAMAFIGSLGGGKSMSNNLVVYYSVLYGAKAVVLDP